MRILFTTRGSAGQGPLAPFARRDRPESEWGPLLARHPEADFDTANALMLGEFFARKTRMEHGRAVQAQVIGQDTVQRLYAAAPADEQHIQRLLTANCFGDVLTQLIPLIGYPRTLNGLNAVDELTNRKD